MSLLPKSPPVAHNAQDEDRKVGVELEFAGLSVDQTVDLLQDSFGGKAEKVDTHRTILQHEEWGETIVELDVQYVHKNNIENDSTDRSGSLLQDFEISDDWRGPLGDALTGLVPVEIVFPPIPWFRLGDLDETFALLRARGALGTRESAFYAFGLHLNVEVATGSAEEVLHVLQAYLLRSESLRSAVSVDITRRILPHTASFPESYAKTILAAGYPAELERMVEDYVSMNPTRNRELDMLPLFAHLAPELMGEIMDDVLIKPRPTYHYRLPNADLGDPDWSAVTEWNRWVTVEELAMDARRLEAAVAEFSVVSDDSLPVRLRRLFGVE
ncbi:amidoligase family protein [Nisaea sp.]|uniref:amidoligase family protein n=1 Tax=Nisaea sp. TaxID=2024842 RepID=UPI003264F085